MLNEIRENALITALAKGLPRSPGQLNDLHESDAELIRMPGSETILAVTMDSICEEIEAGLYDDPFMIGWMTVIVNASDLAAVGAEPLGIILSETLPGDADKTFLEELQRGIAEACSETELPVLGGDTNFSDHLHMSACAFGTVPGGKPIQRIGCQIGDHLFASNFLGLGNGYAFTKFFAPELTAGIDYRPEPPLKQAQILRKYASCCMDTSDGAVATFDQLMRLNNTGFNIDIPVERYIDPQILKLCQKTGLPAWLTLAGFHGEFELIFTMSADRVEAFKKEAKAANWSPLYLGQVTGIPELRLQIGDSQVDLDTVRIRNLFTEVGGDLNQYLNGLTRIAKQ